MKLTYSQSYLKHGLIVLWVLFIVLHEVVPSVRLCTFPIDLWANLSVNRQTLGYMSLLIWQSCVGSLLIYEGVSHDVTYAFPDPCRASYRFDWFRHPVPLQIDFSEPSGEPLNMSSEGVVCTQSREATHSTGLCWLAIAQQHCGRPTQAYSRRDGCPLWHLAP